MQHKQHTLLNTGRIVAAWTVIAVLATAFPQVMFQIKETRAAQLQEAFVRLDRMKASTATSGTVCASSTTSDTEDAVEVTFPTGFTVNGTAGNWTVTTTNLPAGATAWPGIGTATDVTDQTVTFPSDNLTPETLYCFNFAGSDTLTTSTAGSDLVGNIATVDSGSDEIDSADYATAVIADDQITITATVPPTFSFVISDNTDEFTDNLSSTSIISTGGVTVTIGTNAANGWVTWLKSANTSLDSAITGESIETQGSVDGSCTTLQNGEDHYQLAVTASNGTLGTSNGITVADEYDCGATAGGTFSDNFEEIASADGTVSGDELTLTARATISPLKSAATDYTDTWTVVGAGNF